MGITAAIRSILITFIASGLGWLVAALGLAEGVIDVDGTAAAIANVVVIFGSGLVAYAVNKLGSKWEWINTILSFGRARSPAIYVEKDQTSVTATVTPPGMETEVVSVDAFGLESPAKV